MKKQPKKQENKNSPVCGKCSKPKKPKQLLWPKDTFFTPVGVGEGESEYCECGRPTAYKPNFPQLLIKHFEVPSYTETIAESTEEYYKDGTLKKKSHKKKLIPNELPTLLTFARMINVSYGSVWRWAHAPADSGYFKKEFSEAYKQAKESQKQFLMNNGLSGASPSPAYIFTAKNVTDMRDEQVVDTKHSGSVEVKKKVEEMTKEELEAELQSRLLS